MIFNTKKTTARIYKEVLKHSPNAPKRTTNHQAFEILAEAWNVEISIGTTRNVTMCQLFRDNEQVKLWRFNDVWDNKVNEWDWDTIFKTILEDIIKEKLYKRPKNVVYKTKKPTSRKTSK